MALANLRSSLREAEAPKQSIAAQASTEHGLPRRPEGLLAMTTEGDATFAFTRPWF